MDGLTVVSYNIKGLGSPIKIKKILNQLKALHCSIAMLQETHLSEVEHLKLRRDWVEQIYSASHKGGRKRGVAILFGRNVFFNNNNGIGRQGWQIFYGDSNCSGNDGWIGLD